MEDILAFVTKGILIFIFTFLLTRIMSKKAMSQLSAFELAGIMILSNVASEPLTTNSVITTILGLGIITALMMIAGKMALFNKLTVLMEDVPTVLVENGKIDMKALKKEYMSLGQFLALIRQEGYDSMEDIDYVVLEPQGQLSVFPVPKKKPVTLGDLNLPSGVNGICIPVIMDGTIIKENIQKTAYSENDILSYLDKKNITSLSDVVLAEVNPNGKISVLKKEFIN